MESDENPLVWCEYCTWASENFFNSFQLKQLEHKALNALLAAPNTREKYGHAGPVFDLFISAVDDAKNWSDLFRKWCQIALFKFSEYSYLKLK